jgi:YHS domain-containing protein
MPVDPVCGMNVNADEAIDYNDYKGKTYYFCSIECAEKFESDPERYAGPGIGTGLGTTREDVA